MSSEPHGSPAAPERGGRAWPLISRPAAALILTATVATAAVALGAPAVWVLAFVIPCLCAAGLVLHLSRLSNRRLRAAKRQLAASELAYRRRYESVAAGILTIEVDGRVHGANPAALQLLGYDSERELAIVDFGEQVYAAPGTFETLLRRVRLDGEIPAIELSLRRRDGLPVTVAATIRGHWDHSGAVDRYEAAMLDIGELKFVERQRRSHERRFRRLFDANAVGILFGNLRRGTIDEANGRMREIADLRSSELPVLLDALAVDGQPLLAGAILVALESDGHTPPLEAVFHRADGATIAVLVCAAIVDPLQGEFVAVVAERPTAEQAPRAPDPERLYASVLDALPFPVARFNRSAQLSYCNAACRASFGFPATPVGLAIGQLLGGDGPDALRIDVVLSGETVQIVTEVFLAAGGLRELEVTLTPHRRADGAIGGFLATMREPRAAGARPLEPRPPAVADNTYNMKRW